MLLSPSIVLFFSAIIIFSFPLRHRFEFRDVSAVVGRQGMSFRGKIDTFVDFPVDDLDLAAYCGDLPPGSQSPQDGECREGHRQGEALLQAFCPPPPRTQYDLFAVCNHYGQLGSGHYTANARDWLSDGRLSSSWEEYDDDSVTACADVKSNAAYMLFYRRKPAMVSDALA